jgi:Ni/Fe-hydrogenase 1 B-type cytochrome subunit
MFLWQKPPAAEGHNPVAGLAYTIVFALYVVMIATGLGLYAIDADLASPLRGFDALLPLFGGAPGARWTHHVVMWLLIGFAVHHIYSAVLVSLVEKNGEIDSIVSGYKWVSEEDRE